MIIEVRESSSASFLDSDSTRSLWRLPEMKEIEDLGCSPLDQEKP